MSWRDIKFFPSERVGIIIIIMFHGELILSLLGCCRLSKCNANFGKFLKRKLKIQSFIKSLHLHLSLWKGKFYTDNL